jgi:putative aldouronate transport system substrate-binding protein
MKKHVRLLAIILALALCFSLFAACGSSSDGSDDSSADTNQTTNSSNTDNSNATDNSDDNAAPDEDDPFANGVQYPLVTDGSVSLEIMLPIAGFLPLVEGEDGLNSTRGVQMWAEATGIDFYWQEIDQDAYSDQFNIMVVSGDYPDMVASPESYYTGGIDAVIDDDFCIDLVQFEDTYLKDYFDYCSGDEYASYLKRETSDTGKICTVWSLVDSITMGLQIRQDWLDAVGMDVPETYDELYDVMKAFQSELGITSPLYMTAGWCYGSSSNTNLFVGGYKTSTGAQIGGELDWLVNEDGEAVCCAITDEFKEYLQLLNKWWDEKIISEDSLVIENMQEITDYVQQGKAGFWGGQTDMLTVEVDDTFNAVPIKNIVKNKGETIITGNYKGVRGNAGWAVTTACEYPELAAGAINWFWTDEGYTVANYGEEGVTFNYVNGEVEFTDLILNNPNGFNPMFNSCSEILFFDFPFEYNLTRKSATFSTQAEIDSQEIWGSNETDELQYYGDLNADESAIYSSYVGDIATYVSENVSQFVTGAKSFDDWDAYVAQIEQLGVQQLIDVKTAAYQRYLNR